jgi:Domain of unknown function (DUF5658)
MVRLLPLITGSNMTATAHPAFSLASCPLVPKVSAASCMWPSFGDAALGIFLLTQVLDGVCTYAGVLAFGIHSEANPIVAALMIHLGHAPGLLIAKIAASGLGICLYIGRVHSVVALLAGVYLTVAIGPWTYILFF